MLGDATRLSQILSNLLNNAAKYQERGGHIAVLVERDGEQAVIRVRDQGIGLPPEILPRVFEPFMQVDGNLHRAEGGLGLGLALVRSLVELHGGRVRALSEGPGRGTEMEVRLPLRVAAASEPARNGPSAPGTVRAG